MKLIPYSYQTPNAYVDLFLPYLKSDEWRVLSYAIRHIFGWDERIESRRRRMSISTFEHGVPGFPGCGLSRPAIVRAVGTLTKYGLMKKVGAPTHQGQLYELPIDSAEVDLTGLKERSVIKKTDSKQRTEMARLVSATDRALVSLINQILVSRTNRQWLVRLTASGKSDLPTQSQPFKTNSQSQISKPSSKEESSSIESSTLNLVPKKDDDDKTFEPVEKSLDLDKPKPSSLNGNEQGGATPKPPPPISARPPSPEYVMRECWRDYFGGPVPPIIEPEVIRYANQYQPAQIREAFEQAANYNGKAWAYVRKVFDGMEKPETRTEAKAYTAGKFSWAVNTGLESEEKPA